MDTSGIAALWQAQLQDLLQVKLFHIGTQALELLLRLSNIADPSLPSTIVISTLGRMFEELPRWLEQTSAPEIIAICHNPPPDAVHLRMLLAFHELSSLLLAMSHEQLLHLHHFQPPGPQQQRMAFFQRIQQAFQRQQTRDNVERLRILVSQTPEESMHDTLLQIDPVLMQRDLPTLISLLHLSSDELARLLNWFPVLDAAKMLKVTQLLELDLPILFELKKIFESTLVTQDVLLDQQQEQQHQQQQQQQLYQHTDAMVEQTTAPPLPASASSTSSTIPVKSEVSPMHSFDSLPQGITFSPPRLTESQILVPLEFISSMIADDSALDPPHSFSNSTAPSTSTSTSTSNMSSKSSTSLTNSPTTITSAIAIPTQPSPSHQHQQQQQQQQQLRSSGGYEDSYGRVLCYLPGW
jgi:hypothetical protein